MLDCKDNCSPAKSIARLQIQVLARKPDWWLANLAADL